MKKSVQERIDEFMEMAQKSGTKASPRKPNTGARPQNGLSSVIHSQHEADVFMAQVRAMVHMATCGKH